MLHTSSLPMEVTRRSRVMSSVAMNRPRWVHDEGRARRLAYHLPDSTLSRTSEMEVRVRSICVGTVLLCMACGGQAPAPVVGTPAAAMREDPSEFLRPSFTGDITAVWTDAPDSAWLASGTELLHWDGAWFDGFDVGGLGVTGFKVGAIGGVRSSLWAIATPGIVLRWNGHTWSREWNDATATLEHLWSPDGTTVWISGTRLSGMPIALFFDGASWREETVHVLGAIEWESYTTSAIWTSVDGEPSIGATRSYMYYDHGPLQDPASFFRQQNIWREGQSVSAPQSPIGYFVRSGGYPSEAFWWDGAAWRWSPSYTSLGGRGDFALGRLCLQNPARPLAVGAHTEGLGAAPGYGYAELGSAGPTATVFGFTELTDVACSANNTWLVGRQGTIYRNTGAGFARLRALRRP